MITAHRASTSNLGALPVLLVTALTSMGQYMWTRAQIQYALGQQFEELQKLTEGQITELSILLSEHTNKQPYEWFTILRNAIDVCLFSPGDGTPPPEPEPEPTDNKILYISLAVAAAALLLTLTR